MPELDHFIYNDKTRISVVKGDITLVNTDIIVVPVNTSLSLNGGLAEIILKKAG